MTRPIKFRAKRTDDDSEMLFFDLTEGSLNIPFIVENYELMQFTGLIDKAGVEIYEGDILAGNWIVVWREAGFYLHTPKLYEDTLYMAMVEKLESEVIGNIYENGDLLEGER